ncbi:MAG: T9SS type A sorting domain-containing protein [Prevotella sp.]|nr:T9SS type A sorting domain-containing protein [Prevotella sp.]
MFISTANCSIDISDLKSGSYILTIQSGNKRQSAKFIKK